ncbi:MAG: TIGR00725 family protein [Candidatus Zixiibacteriota bacterium]
MAAKRKPVIAIIGGGACSQEQADMAAAAGRIIAENGGVVVCGGLGGTMLGAARGAREAGGVTIGIIPSDNKNDANEHIDYVIPTGLGEARNALVVRTADAVLAFPGSYGTLSEISFALIAGKPLVTVGGWEFIERAEQFDDPVAAARRALELAREWT